MTSDFEKRSQGSTENTGSPADFTAGGYRQTVSGNGTTTGGTQSGFGENLAPGQSLPAAEEAFGQRGTSASSPSQTYGESPRGDHRGGVAHAVGRETDSAKAELGSAREEVKQGISGLGEAARDKAYEGAEKGREQITSSLGDFAAAVRKASEELGERDQSMAAGLVREVANGLEQATGAIHGKSVQDLTRSVASFARRQPTTFLIGAALAGIALGRFARASGEHAPSDRDRWNESRSGGGHRGPGNRQDDDLHAHDGGDTRTSPSGLTPGRSAVSTPVSPPVSAGTTAPSSTTMSGGATVTGVRPEPTGTASTGPAPAEGPSGAVLGHGSGSFNPQGGRDVR